ncbi:MAG: glycosyltransferase family 39 protein [Anaerolineae bacterium]
MSSRIGYVLAVALLLVGAGLRMAQFTTLPNGFSNAEITDIRITERVRQGGIEVYYDLGAGEGREGLYHAVQAVVTSVFGSGIFGYRLLAFWLGMLVLAVVYSLAQRLFGALVAVGALALLTTNMWSILLSRQVGRETVLPLLVALILLTLARTLSIYRGGRVRIPDTTAFALLGGLLGLGFYIHPAHFLIVLFSMLVIGFRLASKQRLSRQTISYLLFSLLLMIIIAVPYLVSSIRLPDLSGATRVFDHYTVVGNPPLKAVADTIGGILFVGDKNPATNVPDRPMVDLVSGLLVAVGVLGAIQNHRQGRYALLLIATVVLLPAAILRVRTPDFRAMSLLLPLIVIYFGIGISTVYRSVVVRGRPVLWAGALVLLVFNFYWMGKDLFNTWPNLDSMEMTYHTRAGRLAHFLDHTADTIPTVICDSKRKLEPNDVFSSTDLTLLMMNQKITNFRYADCGSGMIFINGGAMQQVIMPDPDTLTMMQPYLREWLNQGTQLQDMPADSIIQFDVTQSLADTVGRFTTTTPGSYAPESPGGVGVATPPVRFGGNIAFLGYEKDGAGPYAPGGIFTSITYWRVDGEVPPDLRFFTHILADPAASPTVQNDTISVNVSQLQPRDIFVQIMFLPLPPSILVGEYGVSIGASTAANDSRLPVMDGEQVRGDRLFLGSITVQ